MLFRELYACNDVLGGSDIDSIADIVPELTGFLIRTEWVAGVILIVWIHDLSRERLTEDISRCISCRVTMLDSQSLRHIPYRLQCLASRLIVL